MRRASRASCSRDVPVRPGNDREGHAQAMVTRMNQSMSAHKVSAATSSSAHAGIHHPEGGSEITDFYKVSRVFINRLAKNMPLQSDATVSYGAGRESIETHPGAARRRQQPYNTYAHAGLPIGPISSPATPRSMRPFIRPPAPGSTSFSSTAPRARRCSRRMPRRHDAGVKQWQAWLKAHPGYGS